ncbi:hypothetical protein VaNZ11_006019 [Volvox africanus]|uniref:Glycosyltransferase family 34 protein n=1 Tax=Volvox africanus TaxID=51714 RepID=A0ABQ5S0D1_9CHLO|nr:hypothetical protein VaNZ11_006019 [Volvox africanus]
MGKFLRILQFTVLAIFVIFVWPYVFIVSRDLLLHKGHHCIYDDELPERRNITITNMASASPYAGPLNCSLCADGQEKICSMDEVGHVTCVEGKKDGSHRPRIALITVVILPKANHFVTDHSQLRFGHIMENFVNKFKYAHRHNYDFVPIFWNFKDPDLPGAWAKVIAIQRHLPHYDWIWCTDVDAFVTNRYLSIEEHVLKHVPPDKAFVVARDCNHLNTGSFFIRNTPAAFRFLDAVYAQSRNTSLHLYDVWYEQSAIIHVFDHDIQGLTSILHMVPQQMINSYRINCGHMWQLHDFVVHFPGQDNKQGAWADLLREGGAALLELLP